MIIIIILFFVIISQKLKRNNYKEKFFLPMSFSRIIKIKSSSQRKQIVNTPLVSLYSEYKEIENFIPPNFFCFNFEDLSAVKDQGYLCGSCWAMVVSGLLADRIIFRYNATVNIDLSEQQLLDCYNKDGCNGASPEEVFKWMIDTKFVLGLQKNEPYEQMNTSVIKGKCHLHNENDGISLNKDVIYSLVIYTESTDPNNPIIKNNVLNMKKELIINGPFFATISIYADFFKFVETEPYYNKTNILSGGHAIIIVGYCNPGTDSREKYNQGYWICKNSWGKLWPKNSIYPGYFTILMGKNVCGIESRCGSISPDVKDIIPKNKLFAITDINYWFGEFINTPSWQQR